MNLQVKKQKGHPQWVAFLMLVRMGRTTALLELGSQSEPEQAEPAKRIEPRQPELARLAGPVRPAQAARGPWA